MKNLLFKKRLLAAIIDFIIIFMVSFTVCALIITSIFKDSFDQQAAPFAAMTLLINPLYSIVSYGKAYGIFVMLMIDFVIEVLYYSLFELLPTKRTPGYALLGIHICCNSDSSIPIRIIGRNIIKVLSRYLYCIPFIISMFNVNSNTIYDLVSKIHVETDNISRE